MELLNKFATAIFKTELTSFLESTINECPVTSDLAIHKLLAFCPTFFLWSGILKIDTQSKKLSFLKNIENVLRPALSCINLRMDDLCKNHQMHPSHYLCLITSINWIVFLLLFSPYCFQFVVVSLLYSYFSGLCAFLWFHQRQKCL